MFRRGALLVRNFAGADTKKKGLPQNGWQFSPINGAPALVNGIAPEELHLDTFPPIGGSDFLKKEFDGNDRIAST